jgi:SAM-dependent methyltransferase
VTASGGATAGISVIANTSAAVETPPRLSAFMSETAGVRNRILSWSRTAVGELLYERRFGLDTSGHRVGPEYDDENLRYEPMGWRTLWRWLDPAEVGPEDVLLDAGCGKGRVVFQAARRYPLRRIVGFDISPELIEIARGNVERNRRRLRCRDIELVVADAREWMIPDDVTIVVLYNSFVGEVLDGFLRQLIASVDRRPRDVRLIYLNATRQTAVEATGRFRLVGGETDRPPPPEDTGPYVWAGVRIYELAPR